MKTSSTRRRRLWVLSALLFPAVAAYAQITVTSNDILALIGKSQEFETDTTGSITVNVGAGGANQIWDFRNVALQADRFDYAFLAPQATPFPADFPQANFAQRSTTPSQPGSAFYSYSQVTSNSLRALGGAAQTPDTSFVLPFESEVAPLPLQFGTTWNTVESDTFGTPPDFYITTTNTSNNSAEAWGTVRLPIGDFACLRVRSDNKTVSKTVVGGVVFSSDSSTTIDYLWVSKANFFVAQVSSQDNETNPNFSDASSFGRLSSLTTGVTDDQDRTGLPARFALAQNFPNPFNPETAIRYTLPAESQVKLAVYDLSGRLVATLSEGAKSAGEHEARWNGRDSFGNPVTSGLYLYRLEASARHGGAITLTRKLTVLK